MSSIEEQVYGVEDLSRINDVVVKEWGITVDLVSPSAEVRAVYIAAYMSEPDDAVRAAMAYPMGIVMCCCAPGTDDRVFTAPDAVERLGKKNGRVVEALGQLCQKVMGLDEEEYEEGKDDSSSETATEGTSTSASPSPST